MQPEFEITRENEKHPTVLEEFRINIRQFGISIRQKPAERLSDFIKSENFLQLLEPYQQLSLSLARTIAENSKRRLEKNNLPDPNTKDGRKIKPQTSILQPRFRAHHEPNVFKTFVAGVDLLAKYCFHVVRRNYIGENAIEKMQEVLPDLIKNYWADFERCVEIAQNLNFSGADAVNIAQRTFEHAPEVLQTLTQNAQDNELPLNAVYTSFTQIDPEKFIQIIKDRKSSFYKQFNELSVKYCPPSSIRKEQVMLRRLSPEAMDYICTMSEDYFKRMSKALFTKLHTNYVSFPEVLTADDLKRF